MTAGPVPSSSLVGALGGIPLPPSGADRQSKAVNLLPNGPPLVLSNVGGGSGGVGTAGFNSNFLAAYGDAADPEPAAYSNWYDDAADPEPVSYSLPTYSSASRQATVVAGPLRPAASPVPPAGGYAGGWYDDAADPEPASYFSTTIGKNQDGSYNL